MKNFLLLIILCFSCIGSKAQNYVPVLDSVSNTWYYVFNIIPVRQQSVVQPNRTYWYLGGSLDEKNNVNSFSISPNPLNNDGEITIQALGETEAEVFIYSLDGQ